MCRACPRDLGVKRYWYLPHWTMPNTAKRLARYQALAHAYPQNVAEYDCDHCETLHQNVSFFKFRTPIRIDDSPVSHFGLCPTDGTIIYIRC